MSQLPHSARVEALLASGRAELDSPTLGVETAPERPTVPRGDATAADPRRAVLDRIALEVLSARQYHAPAVLVADFIDAILAQCIVIPRSAVTATGWTAEYGRSQVLYYRLPEDGEQS